MKRVNVIVLMCAVAVALTAGAAFAEEKLLTENGLTNPKYSLYKTKPMHKTGGTYLATPGTQETANKVKELTFAEGRLTNGDVSYQYKRTPGPYTYWSGKKKATLVMDFKASMAVARINMHILNSGPHGTKSAKFFKSVDGKTWEEFKAIEEIANGWNKLADLNVTLRYLKVEFAVQVKKTFITCSEIEVWGAPVAAP